jgi:trans-aconitate methyltransferase
MDRDTFSAYERDASAYAEDWHEQPPPADLHALVRRFFTPGPTADIGCGSGRDAAWLAAHGFPCIGFDASPALLTEARRRYPSLRFEQALLPALREIADAQFTNVLCETVIMHLPPPSVPEAVQRLVALLEPHGTLYLSWRVTADADRRDDHGRLYSAFDAGVVHCALGDAAILHDEELTSLSSGKIVHRVIARKD